VSVKSVVEMGIPPPATAKVGKSETAPNFSAGRVCSILTATAKLVAVAVAGGRRKTKTIKQSDRRQ